MVALAGGLFISRWVLAAVGKTDFGLYGVVGGMMVIALLAFTVRPVRGRNATLSLPMGFVPMKYKLMGRTGMGGWQRCGAMATCA